MKMPKIFMNRQFRWVAIVIVIFMLVLTFVNVFMVGGDVFIYNLNSSVDPPLSILVTVFAALLWRRMSQEKHNRFLWSGMFIGWALWTIAEIIWMASTLLGQEVPYPSAADFFWVLGYIPMGIGLIARIRTMPAKPTRTQNLLVFGTSVAVVIVTSIFIFLPIIQYFDPQLMLASILDFVYPLGDLFLLIVVLNLFFTYEEGDYGFAWRLLAIGFLLMAISDFVFTYATWQEIYYPGGEATFVSRLIIDVPYTFSFLFWLAGILALYILVGEARPVGLGDRLRRVRTYGHILVYTRDDDTVIDVSPNFQRFFSSGAVIGRSLAETLSLPEEDARVILDKIRDEGRLVDLPLQIRDFIGALRDVNLCGAAVYNIKNEYAGGNLLLRVRVKDTSFDKDLSPESRSLARHLLERSGSSYKAEIGQFLSDYYLTHLRSLLDMAEHHGGQKLSQALLDRLGATARANHWQMKFNPRTVMDSTDYPLEVLQEALPLLLESAKGVISEVTDPAVVRARLAELDLQLGETVRRDVEFYGKYKGDMGFSDHRKRTR